MSEVTDVSVELPYDPAILALGIYPENNQNSSRCMHSNVHSSTIYNSQNMETT